MGLKAKKNCFRGLALALEAQVREACLPMTTKLVPRSRHDPIDMPREREVLSGREKCELIKERRTEVIT
jgi:hypothetical protein